MILLTIGPFTLLNLLINIVNFPISMLHPSIPVTNIFLAIGVSIRSFSFLFAINIITLIKPSIFPHGNSITMKFILFPSSLILHGCTFIMTLTIKLVGFPKTLVGTAIVVNYCAESLFFVVFEVSCVFVALCQ